MLFQRNKIVKYGILVSIDLNRYEKSRKFGNVSIVWILELDEVYSEPGSSPPRKFPLN